MIFSIDFNLESFDPLKCQQKATDFITSHWQLLLISAYLSNIFRNTIYFNELPIEIYRRHFLFKFINYSKG